MGSGTSYHAGLVSTYLFSALAKFPVRCELAPEFPYLIEPIVSKKVCYICISQSGESELTVYSAEKANAAGAVVVAITNNIESKLAKIAGQNTLLTKAGAEKSVMATKTYIAQLTILTALAIEIGMLKGTITKEKYEKLYKEFNNLPGTIESALSNMKKEIEVVAPYFKFASNSFVIGADYNYALAMEAALKLKEGSRIFAQAFSTAEFPHGPITLAEPHTAFCILFTPKKSNAVQFADLIKLVNKLKERGVSMVALNNNPEKIEGVKLNVKIPSVSDTFQPFVSIVSPLLLAVEIAISKNINSIHRNS